MTAIIWPVIGVDPGGRDTGIVLRDRARCLDHAVVRRGNDESMASYIGRVLDLIGDYWCRIPEADGVGHNVAVEGLNDPTPQMGVTSVRGLIGAAQVLGGVLVHWPAATIVPPGGHGSQHLATYPRELVGERERFGAGVLRHARSAWDVAGAAIHTARFSERAGRR